MTMKRFFLFYRPLKAAGHPWGAADGDFFPSCRERFGAADNIPPQPWDGILCFLHDSVFQQPADAYAVYYRAVSVQRLSGK